MSEERVQSQQRIALRAASEDGEQPQIVIEFQPAGEQPDPGMPGKNPGDLVVLPREANAYVLRVSLGKAEKITLETVRRAAGLAGRWLARSGASSAGVEITALRAALPDASQTDVSEAVLSGLVLGAYRFNQYKKPSEETSPVALALLENGQVVNDATLIERVNAICEAVVYARDLAHQPANVINPITLAEEAQKGAEQYGLKSRVMDDRELAEMGAGAILAVGKGSQTPSRMIVLEYQGMGAEEQQPVVLVGKAITFDTGGYSIKSTEGIVGMKYDKCGGVNVLATMRAAAALNLKTHLVGIIAAAENMISGGAYRPNDIIKTLDGKTVEIVSTDAEGRLVLADALTYAQREYRPRAIIDLATLTGGVVVALGRFRAGLLANDDALANGLFAAGEKTGERLWRLPLDEEYGKLMKGDDADLRNSGGRQGHCILGGAFLQAFVDGSVPWAHLDIAGVADNDKDEPYAPKGATGFGIRLLLDYLENL